MINIKGNKMILWVDDDQGSGALNSFIDELKDSGYEIIWAHTPEEMWSQLNTYKEKINGIIMDIMMPLGENIDPLEAQNGVKTGLVLLKKIKENNQYSDMPIFILTILSDQELLDWAMENSIPIRRKQEIYPDEFLEEIKKNIKLEIDN